MEHPAFPKPAAKLLLHTRIMLWRYRYVTRTLFGLT
jgi:hypothetical protein